MNGRWLAAAILGLAPVPLPGAAQETGGGAGRAGRFGHAGVNDQTGAARSPDPNPGRDGITHDGAGTTGQETSPGTTKPGTTNDER